MTIDEMRELARQGAAKIHFTTLMEEALTATPVGTMYQKNSNTRENDMGACGCGDFAATHKFKGPDGYWYAFNVTSGCRDCDTGAGVRLYKMSDEEAEDQGLDEIESEVNFEEMLGEIYIAVIDPHVMQEVLLKWMLSAHPEDVFDWDKDGKIDKKELIEGLKQFVEDAVLETFDDVVQETINVTTPK
jgi:hypothetical protein